MSDSKTALIVGATGQDGAYLAKLLLEKGYEVHGTSRDKDIASLNNLRRLGIAERITLHSAGLTDFRSVVHVLRRVAPREIYHLAGQSSVSLSFDQPVETIDGSINGTINLLEAIRFLGIESRFYHASSSESFGNTFAGPASEETPFHPCSPYGIAKAAAHWAVANYREAYGLHACSGILFNHESPLRPARFVTQKIIRGAVAISEGRADKLHLGNLSVARDWGYAPEYVDAMWRMLQTDMPTDIVIATGYLATLEEFVSLAFSRFNLSWRDHVVSVPELYRPLDVVHSSGNPSKANQLLGWQPTTKLPDLVNILLGAELERRRDDRG
jgi:GDPmannose 4,6-dehydratase